MDDGSGRSGFFSRLFSSHKEETVEDEIVSMLNEGQDQGTIQETEAEMITNIFDLDDKVASEIMTIRKNISAIDAEWTLGQAMDFICEENFSRFPVFEENIDNIIGILHIKDAAKAYLNNDNRSRRVKDMPEIMQKAFFIPETSKLNTIFKSMQAEQTHMEIVVDEYGQTAGLVAMEDILEEIVGNIFDEHDEVEYNIIKTAEGEYDIKGLTSLTEIEQETGVEYDDEENDTLNGYLISLLDRIPEHDEGTEIKDKNIKYKILEVEDKTIALVHMSILDASEKKQEE